MAGQESAMRLRLEAVEAGPPGGQVGGRRTGRAIMEDEIPRDHQARPFIHQRQIRAAVTCERQQADFASPQILLSAGQSDAREQYVRAAHPVAENPVHGVGKALPLRLQG